MLTLELPPVQFPPWGNGLNGDKDGEYLSFYPKYLFIEKDLGLEGAQRMSVQENE